MDIPVTPHPGEKLPENYCAVKVPQFSFSRLAGADPILGVEMASTGEVATFGSPAIKKLHEMDYKLFATAGTADFIKEHGISVHCLEVLNKEEDQKPEYSLTQHLANHLIDLYVSLPSANRFRRPANYMSKGYESRRMAVDYSVSLVTNIKCAKLSIEAIARAPNMEVSNNDAQTSHSTTTLPGLVNISSFVPSLKEFEATTKSTLASGFTFNAFLPQTVSGTSIIDAASLEEAILVLTVHTSGRLWERTGRYLRTFTF
ncbi:hypothetical protein JCM33374_g2270 [Metschnikowia sp. JCM 33374]|nr:hypothetical protein JCM33374_g2270 [Metschnikowia sp. JCM 33374]